MCFPEESNAAKHCSDTTNAPAFTLPEPLLSGIPLKDQTSGVKLVLRVKLPGSDPRNKSITVGFVTTAGLHVQTQEVLSPVKLEMIAATSAPNEYYTFGDLDVDQITTVATGEGRNVYIETTLGRMVCIADSGDDAVRCKFALNVLLDQSRAWSVKQLEKNWEHTAKNKILLFSAVERGDIESITHMIGLGYSIDTILDLDCQGRSILHIAVQAGYFQCLKLLLSIDLINIIIDNEDCFGKTCLDLALEDDKAELADLLKDMGASIGSASGENSCCCYPLEQIQVKVGRRLSFTTDTSSPTPKSAIPLRRIQNMRQDNVDDTNSTRCRGETAGDKSTPLTGRITTPLRPIQNIRQDNIPVKAASKRGGVTEGGETTRTPLSGRVTPIIGTSDATPSPAIDIVANNEAPDLSKYKLMMKRGVPAGGVRHKMTNEGVHSEFIEAFFASYCVEHDDPKKTNENTQRSKMLAMIRSREGNKTPRNQKKAYILADGSAHDSEINLQQPTGTECTNSARPTVADVANDDVLARYAKLKKVGLPFKCIKQKMVEGNVSQEKISLFMQAYDIKEERSQAARQPQCQATPIAERRSSTKLMRAHMTPGKGDVSKSVYRRDRSTYVDDDTIVSLECLFANGYSLPMKSKQKDNNKSKRAGILCAQRQQNVEIGLASLLRLFRSYEEIILAVISLDLSKLDETILQRMVQRSFKSNGSEIVESKSSLLPTKSELAAITRYKGSIEHLSQCEQWFLATSKVQRFEPKLNACLLVCCFTSRANGMIKSLQLLQNACAQIVNNDGLARLLKSLLELSNVLNESYVQPAKSIGLDSIMALAKKKGRDKSTSLIDVVVKQEMGKIESARTVDFMSSLTGVDQARLIDMKHVREEFAALRLEVNKLQELVSAEANKVEPLDKGVATFIRKSKSFLDNAEIKLHRIGMELDNTQHKAAELQLYFAEDAETETETGTIFEVVIEFGLLVKSSKDSWRRKDQAEKRRAKKRSPHEMIATPTDTSNTLRKSNASGPSATSGDGNICPTEPLPGKAAPVGDERECLRNARKATLAAIMARRKD